MKKWLVAIACVLGLTFGWAGEARATIIWGWGITDELGIIPIDTFSVSPSDSITIHGRLFNGFLSDTNFTDSNLSIFTMSFGSLSGVYDFNFGDFSEFTDLDLAPGEGINFVYGTLHPIGGTAPVGTYAGSASISSTGASPSSVANPFEVHVLSPVIPEPGSLTLVALGVLAAGFKRRRFPS